MKCTVLLLTLLALYLPATQACDASDAGSCVGNYVTDLLASAFNSQTTVCSVTQDVIACLNKACPGGVPDNYVSTINEQLKNVGVECDLSSLKTSGSELLRAPCLGIVVVAALAVTVFFRG